MIHRINLSFIFLFSLFLLAACSSKPVYQPIAQGTWTQPQTSYPNDYYPLYRDDGLPHRHYGGSSDVFPRPAEIEPQVDFWRKVYSKWGRSQFAVHDKVHMDIIYDVFELPGETADILTAGQKAYIQERFYNWKSRLNTLEDKMAAGLPLDANERELVRYVTEKTGHANAIRGASERLRYQRGLKERFMRGLEIGRRYDERFRQIFRNAGLPEDLAYLPHVESSFQYNAHSSAGALGIWQFTSGAAKMFMNDSSAAARLDPINSTHGAARYLAYAYDKLGSWPLAVTSYNHGIGGMQRARNIYGHDFMRIVKHYDHPQFGFASRNYYAEFLAARDIAREPQLYFSEGSDNGNGFAWTNATMDRNAEISSSAPEPQEVPQPMETTNPTVPESTLAVATEPEPADPQPIANDAVYQAEPIQSQPFPAEPAESTLTQPVSAEPVDHAESTLTQSVLAEPVDRAESTAAEPVLAEAESAQAVSTTVVDVADPIEVAEPATPEAPKSAHIVPPVPRKTEKPSLTAGPKKATLVSTPTPNKKPVQTTVTMVSKKIPLVKAPVNSKKPHTGVVPVAVKQVAKPTVSNHKQIGKASPASTKPIHPATASILQDNRQKPHSLQKGDKKPGEKIHIGKR